MAAVSNTHLGTVWESVGDRPVQPVGGPVHGQSCTVVRSLYVVRSNSQLVRQQMVCLPACPALRSNSQLVRQQMACFSAWSLSVLFSLPAPPCWSAWCLSLRDQAGCSLRHTTQDSLRQTGASLCGVRLAFVSDT